MNIKHSLIAGAAVTTLAAGIGGVGLVSAATNSNSTTSPESSLVDKIATKFNLKKSDVQAVFDQDHKDHEAQREADQKAKLATAVKDGKLTQAQADYITKALSDIKMLRGDSDPKNLSDSVKAQIKTKMDDLRTWATSNKVDMQYVMAGPGGHGPGRMGPGATDGSMPTPN